ncbi:MAG: trypsin-like cysteine/serine peptidase domain-containing protein [Monoraphidium minutum]|nr:MAG: trypsin-like cysteine/serine peptidase domain-containing protein [Monoraphidium minutum]
MQAHTAPARRHSGACALAAALLVLLASGAAAQRPSDGLSGVRPSVVGGSEAPVGRFPYQLLLEIVGYENGSPAYTITCGASLLRADVALTAAHCVRAFPDYYGITDQEFYLHAGAHGDPLAAGAEGTRYGPTPAFASHSEYGTDDNANDVALVYLDRCVALGPRVQLATLATKQELESATRAGSVFVASGWGKTSQEFADPGGSYPLPQLQYGLVRPVRHGACAGQLRDLGLERPLPKAAVCAYGLPAVAGGPGFPPMQDTCQGDSGGPLAFSVDPSGRENPIAAGPAGDRIVGITSFGLGCGELNAPGVYASVPALSGWIKRQLQTRKSPCGEPAAAASCAREGGTRGYAAAPQFAVKVDRRAAYAQCCAECAARAEAGGEGCAAFAVTLDAAAGARRRLAAGGGAPVALGDASLAAGRPRRAKGGPIPVAGAARIEPPLAAPCETCDADCNIYTRGVPERACRGAAKESFDMCGLDSLGSGRIVFG